MPLSWLFQTYWSTIYLQFRRQKCRIEYLRQSKRSGKNIGYRKFYHELFLSGLWSASSLIISNEKYLTKVLGTPIFGRKTNSNGDPNEITIIRAGIFDDLHILNEQKPVAEIYTDRRLKWLNPIEGADQFSGMLPLPWYNYALEKNWMLSFSK